MLPEESTVPSLLEKMVLSGVGENILANREADLQSFQGLADDDGMWFSSHQQAGPASQAEKKHPLPPSKRA
jgi:hypothetical protein